VTDVETGGQIWRLLYNRLLASAVLFQLIMIGVLYLKNATIPAFAIAPIPVITILFKIICSRRYDSRVYYYQPKIDGPSTTYYNGDNKTGMNNNQGSKNSVGFRFGDPAFFAELPIPMVHESVRHLLPKLYGGGKSTTKKPFVSRMTRQKSVRHVSTIQLQNATGGELQFQSVGEKDLELDDSTEGVKGLYKFNEDVESLNVVDPPKTSYYSNSFASPHPIGGGMNPLKRLSNRFSLNYKTNHNNSNNDIYSPQRPLVASTSSYMDTPAEDEDTSYYHNGNNYNQQQRTPPPSQRQMTEDMEYFVAGRAYGNHDPHHLDSSNVIEMANIYRAQQQPYQPSPTQNHSMVDNYNQYIRNPVDAYANNARTRNYHPQQPGGANMHHQNSYHQQ
jgi:hypothetical protein